MQLIDSTQTQLAGVNRQLLDVLQDIACNIEIQSNFCIRHPNYKPLELPSDAVARFQNLPSQMQQKYLSLQLQSFLYGIYYNGYLRSQLALDNQGNNLPIDLENNSVLGVDVGFYERLHESNRGEGYFDAGWSVLKEEIDGCLAVSKSGLRLHLKPTEIGAVVGDSVAIRMPKNCVQDGFYIAVSNTEAKISKKIVRVYFNLTPEGAVSVMGNLTQMLNAIPVFFHFKVLYNPEEYKRVDSCVLYFEKSDYEVVQKVLKAVYVENQAHFKSEAPLFTKQLAPGLGLAEEPDEKFAGQESFGMHRCQIVANGLLSAWYKDDNSPEGRMQAIIQQFTSLEIDLNCPYLNPSSEDIYRVLDIDN
jgi:hypothetical protein